MDKRIGAFSKDIIVTIIIPHYKTLELTRFCLEFLKKNTDLSLATVFVVDNESNDPSLDYLRTLGWIRLFERKSISDESASEAHARALDLGLAHTQTPYVLSFHTDTIAISPGWLTFLIDQIEQAPDIAGVGSWKLEEKPPHKKIAKKIERFWETRIWFPITGKKYGHIAGTGEHYYYLRSHCALYKTRLLLAHTNGFSDQNETAGKVLHKKLVQKGFQMNFIPPKVLLKYVQHLNHATMILNVNQWAKGKTYKKEYRRLLRELKRFNREDILIR
jgi:hypothetical protein